MTNNVMNQYIGLTKKEANEYIKAIFENKFNKKISDTYKETYINIRYYNFYEKENDDMDNKNEEEKFSSKSNLTNALKIAEEKMIDEYPNKEELIKKMNSFYHFFANLDNITYGKEIKETIEKLCKLREKILEKEDFNFEEKIYEIINKYNKEKNDLLENFNNSNEEFYIQSKSYHGSNNVRRIVIKHNVKFPMLYSQEAIEKAFNTGIINEDKLTIEYYLITVEIIKEIVKENFKRQYIIEFATTLLKKKKKLKSLLNIVNNSAILDKISLKIKYKEFLENKESLYELMRNGIKIAIVLDDTFTVNFVNLEKLNMFRYIIINKKLKYYEEILDNKVILNNLIEI